MRKRIVCLLLVLVLLAGIASITSTTVNATSVSQANAVAWAQSMIGVGLDYDGQYGNQCVDLIFYYYNYLGVPSAGGNANAYISNDLPAGWTRITSNIVPQPGDIAVWKCNYNCGSYTTGNYGHIGIVTSGNASVFSVVHQNHLKNPICVQTDNNSTDVLACVIRPNFSSTSVVADFEWHIDTTRHSVGTTDAVLASHFFVDRVDASAFSKVGIVLSDYKGKLITQTEETPNYGHIYECYLWYEAQRSLEYILHPGTTYKYQFWVEVYGERYYSPEYSITTLGTHIHEYNNGTVTVNPGCGTTGTRKYVCVTCGETKTETIPALYPHTYTNACDASCNRCGAARTVTHSYAGATCTDPKTCTVCGATSGSALGHSYTNDCDASCNRCGAARSITHNYAGATCTAPKTCTVCGVTTGTSLGHTYTNACDASCNRCGAARTVTHNYAGATCTDPKTCTVCGATTGTSLGHSYTNDCDASCNRCGAARTVTHNYAGATCTDPKTCTECGVTTGTSLGHSYTNDCDASCNRCGAARTVTHSYAGATCTDPKTCTVCGVTTGTSLGHSYVTTTTKATFTRPGSVVSACNTCGDIASETTISCVSAVELSATSYTYDGKVKTPSVALADSTGRILTEGMDYAVDYDSGRTAVGTYNVVITLMGDYSGTKVLAFEILPQPVKVTITTQPKTQKVEEGNDIKLAVKATGEDLIYQWQSSADGKTWKNCSSSSAKKATFTFTAKTRHNGNYYRCKVTDYTGNTIYTNTVRTYVLGVTTQPKTQKVEAGDKVKFTVTATGAGKTYQWQYSTDGKTWKNCSSSSATSATFSFTSKTSHSGNYYRCRVKDNAGNTVYTDTVRLYVLGITEQPVSKTVTKGKTAKFTVEATGASKTYQWQYSTNGGKTWKNCSSSSAKKATFTFTSKASHNGNYYRCRIKDSGGNTVYTNKVKLTVK